MERVLAARTAARADAELAAAETELNKVKGLPDLQSLAVRLAAIKPCTDSQRARLDKLLAEREKLAEKFIMAAPPPRPERMARKIELKPEPAAIDRFSTEEYKF